jgi:hypothetical protein
VETGQKAHEARCEVRLLILLMENFDLFFFSCMMIAELQKVYPSRKNSHYSLFSIHVGGVSLRPGGE